MDSHAQPDKRTESGINQTKNAVSIIQNDEAVKLDLELLGNYRVFRQKKRNQFAKASGRLW